MTLGKYAPLHKGHQHVIETALSEMDKVMVIIYDSPEVTSVPLGVRASWIKHLYPKVEVLKAWDGPAEVGYTHEIMQAHENYVIQLLGDQNISHFYCSERYGEHMSRALNSIDRRVDDQRKVYPISGTEIRTNFRRYAQFLDPYVFNKLEGAVEYS